MTARRHGPSDVFRITATNAAPRYTGSIPGSTGAPMQRIATAVWKGGPRAGSGTITSSSGTLNQLPFAPSYVSEEHPCTNPCELLAAAHASCVTFALVQEFAGLGQTPQAVLTDAILFMDEEAGTMRASRSYLDVRVRGTDLSLEEMQHIVADVVEKCPISKILRATVEITTRVEILPATLFSASLDHSVTQ